MVDSKESGEDPALGHAIVHGTGGRLGFAKQSGIINGGKDVWGVQWGLFNGATAVTGVQFGIFNKTTWLNGIQIGLLNIATDNDSHPILPIINWNF